MNSSNRILLISPNLEPHKCGVSDYTNLLNKYLQQSNCKTFTLAVNDNFCKEIIHESNLVRINKNQKISTKKNIIEQVNNKFQPNLIILNYVSYGFHKYGVPFYLIKLLKDQFKAIPFIVIFHELWPGNLPIDTFKNKLIGQLHQLFTKYLIKKIQPKNIIVNSEIWQRLLTQKNINSTVIPVFSNIELAPLDLNVDQFVASLNISKDSTEIINVAVFGSSGFVYDSVEVINYFQKQSELFKKSFYFICIGKFQSVFTIFQKLHEINPNKFSCQFTGVLSEAHVSYLFQSVHLGLTTYMPQFWGKSGGIAAMMAHGLNILSVSNTISNKTLTANIQLPNNIFSFPACILNCINDEHKIIDEYNKKLFNIFFTSIHSSLH